MECGSLGGAGNVEHNAVGFVQISKIFAMQDAFFIGAEPSDKV